MPSSVLPSNLPIIPQRLAVASSSPGLHYFGQSLHGMIDVNGDGLVDLAVGALGAAVIVWSRSVVRIESSLTFEPQKINVFNKDCRRGGKEVTCMSAIVCLSLDTRSGIRTGTNSDVGKQSSTILCPLWITTGITETCPFYTFTLKAFLKMHI